MKEQTPNTAQQALAQDQLNFKAIQLLPEHEVEPAKDIARAHLEQNRDVIEQAAIDAIKEAGVDTTFGEYSQNPVEFSKRALERANGLVQRALDIRRGYQGTRNRIPELQVGGSIPGVQDRSASIGTENELVSLVLGPGGAAKYAKSITLEDGEKRDLTILMYGNGKTDAALHDPETKKPQTLPDEVAASYIPKIIDEFEQLMSASESAALAAETAHDQTTKQAADTLFK